MKSKKQLTVMTILVVLLISIIPTVAFAYTLLGFPYQKFDSNSITYSYEQQGTVNRLSQISTSMARWNGSGANISCTYDASGSGNVYINTADYGNTSWAGRCSYPAFYMPNGAVININDYFMWSTAYVYNVVQHEMGHAYGLDHTSDRSALMYDTMQDTVVYPSADDVAGVNSRYY